MQYIVIPKSKIEEVSKEELDELHLSPRYSIDGADVILKLVHYETLFPTPITLEIVEEGEEVAPIKYPYPIYEWDKINELLNTKEWTSEDIPL